MPVPTLDFRRDNAIDHEGRTFNDWSGVRERLSKQGDHLAATAFRDGLPENIVNAMLAQLSNTRVRQEIPGGTGFAPLDVLTDHHGSANSFTNTVTLNPDIALEELLHLTDLNAEVPLSKQKAFRDAIHLGTGRLAEDKGIKGFARNGKLLGMARLKPTGRIGQLINEDPQSPNYDLGKKFFSSHGRAYEIGNQLADFPRFSRDAAAVKEAFPALMEMLTAQATSKIPYEYYPETMKVIDSWADSIPYYEGEYGSKEHMAR